ncbi:beta-1,3-galactosyltransferase pvg3-like [Magnolia sinica]|uniref:beta-1,3-galactosyltransferase pvg3-like n=1 Tax=Magnolia sinica TaxID=86752 RepID=UPI0026581C44|nr:beta-1,3-galactosyltransferase pvg3-like [Magnolia sinica]
MKPAPSQWSISFNWAMIGLSSFLLVAIVNFFMSKNEIHLQNLVGLNRPSSFLNVTYSSHLSPAGTPRPAFRLLIGIMTLPDKYRRRNLLRLVYGIQSPANVQVDVKFVFCNLTNEDQMVLVALEIMRYNDIIILNCTENMNNGKTYTYFSSLPEILDQIDGSDRPYDYVMKADDDIYLRLDRLVDSLMPLPREDMYHGFVIPCREMNPFGHYMSGMGYTLSWDLVAWIRSSDIPKNQTTGMEDRIVGEWLHKGGRAKNRYNNKPAMYNYPADVAVDPCSHEFIPDTIAVHRLKDQAKWIRTLQYFNVTDQLKPSKMYHIP